MKKLRNSLVAFVLVAIMSGSALLGIGAGSIANAASSQHVSASLLAGKSTTSVAFKPLVWCPTVGIEC
jgi:hypothetical protein